jgi:tripartite-type tricarboxylate transporter receptor subunit TctC
LKTPLRQGETHVHVPYKGAGPAITNVVGGQCELVFVNIPPVLGHIRAGKLNAIAVTTLKRASVLPDVPTVAESGLRGYESTTWYGVLGPAGLPREIVTKLHSAIVSTIAVSEIRQRLIALGSEPETNTPEQFAGFIRSDIASWAKVVKSSGAKAE